MLSKRSFANFWYWMIPLTINDHVQITSFSLSTTLIRNQFSIIIKEQQQFELFGHSKKNEDLHLKKESKQKLLEPTSKRTSKNIVEETHLVSKSHPKADTKLVSKEISSQSGNREDAMTVDETFRQLIKEHRNSNAPKKLFRIVEKYANESRLDQNMTLHAFRVLQRMNRCDLSLEVIPLWHTAVNLTHSKEVDIDTALALLRSCCKLQRINLAEGIAARAGVLLESDFNLNNQECRDNITLSPNLLVHYTKLLPELAVGYASIASYQKSLSALYMMKKYGIFIDIEISRKILKSFIQLTNTAQIRLCMKSLLRIGGLEDRDSLQLLTNTFMQSIDFVKGNLLGYKVYSSI